MSSSLLTSAESDMPPSPPCYRLVGRVRQKLLDEVALLTARLFGVPIALVAWAPDATNWLGEGLGFPRRGPQRSPPDLLCAAIRSDNYTPAQDLEEHLGRLLTPATNRLIPPFSAAQSLSDGQGGTLGALCLFDEVPRTLTALEQTLFGQLAHLVALLLALRATAEAEMEQFFWTLVEDSLGPSLRQMRIVINQIRRAESLEVREKLWRTVLVLTMNTNMKLS